MIDYINLKILSIFIILCSIMHIDNISIVIDINIFIKDINQTIQITQKNE